MSYQQAQMKDALRRIEAKVDLLLEKLEPAKPAAKPEAPKTVEVKA